MLALALIAWLAASAPDAPTRIPGTKFSLGMTEIQLQELGAFPTVSVADAAGTTPRQGVAKFFGVACEATLYFRDGRLARAHFETLSISPKATDYVEDQLRREKLIRECTRLEPGNHECDWLGDVKIHLVTQTSRLDARVELPPRPWETEAEPAPVEAPAVAAPETTATVASTPAPAPAPVREPVAPPVTASAAAPLPVPTLPETLRLSLPEKNAPTEWPRMTLVPKLEYPEAARKESVQGIVWVMALVDTDGTVRSATIDKGIRELNAAALAWASKARFAPCVRENRPCRFWVRVAARFTLF